MKKIDLTTVAIVNEALSSIVREMRRAMVRSSYSSIIYEGYDFSCVLLNGEGQLVAESGEDHPFHILPIATAIETAKKIHSSFDKEEMLLHNDPYTGGTHLNDVAVIYPVVINAFKTFYIVIRSHWGDIGGMSPGSLNGNVTEITQEGLRLNFLKVPKSGKSEVMRLIFDNVRVTKEAVSDFFSVIGIIRVAEKRLKKLCQKYTLEVVRNSMHRILDMSERRIRNSIDKLPNGIYSHVGYLDGNGKTKHPLAVKAKISIEDDSLNVDFSGSSAQVEAPLNVGPAIAKTSVLTIMKSFLDPKGSITSGTLRAIEVTLPSNSIVNASAPAPCGGFNEVRSACDSAVMGALGKVIPESITGEVRGTSNHTYIGTSDFIFYEYPSGGTGAWDGSDGNVAVRAFNEGENVSIQSAEIIETIFPLKVRSSGIRPDSGGIGRFRGGVGLKREIEVLASGARLSVLSDRNIVPPSGVAGGGSGAPNRFSVIRDGKILEISDFPGKVANFQLKKFDLVKMESSGGGGWGCPSDRPVKALQSDKTQGYVTDKGAMKYTINIETVEVEKSDTLEFSQGILSTCLANKLKVKENDLIELIAKNGPTIRVWISGLIDKIRKDKVVIASELFYSNEMRIDVLHRY